ncbi:serine/Arginine-related protein 53-like [Tachyglossus aculeatus]|uniref:serine/Arginine-related protein 53-like n=1 Tax=Tachyglossus aculeatus TaxID=9261 RepID=UPI0018F64EF2|nr:serine/Arginine-related protein 53-like [Tachyglossus aculeatus]
MSPPAVCDGAVRQNLGETKHLLSVYKIEDTFVYITFSPSSEGDVDQFFLRGKRMPSKSDQLPLSDCQSVAMDQTTLVEQVKRVKEIEAIESNCFIQQTFRSSKEVKKSAESAEGKTESTTLGVVIADLSSSEKEVDLSSIPTSIKYQDDNSLAHPNLFIEKAEAEEKWFKRLIALRQERLMGSPVA